MFEDHGSLEARVARLETEYAWAEDPPSRTRRLVSNIRVEAGEAEGTLRAKSNLLIYRGRYDSPSYNLIAGERQDVLAPLTTGSGYSSGSSCSTTRRSPHQTSRSSSEGGAMPVYLMRFSYTRRRGHG